MDAKELRIGNYVNLIADGHEHEPDTFKWSIDDYEYYETVMFNILPIPLTEEWLVKFGFEEKDSRKNRFINRADFELEFQGDKVAYCVWGGEDAPHLTQFFGHCKYVHQLQNLYFALTNEELTIKQ